MHSSQPITSAQDSTPFTSVQAPTPIKERIKAKDIGLQIHSAKATGWPKGILYKNKLIEAIENKKYKMAYTTEHMDFYEILEYIRKDNIVLDECWPIMDDDIFRKIRPGRELQRTPPTTREKQRKHSY